MARPDEKIAIRTGRAGVVMIASDFHSAAPAMSADGPLEARIPLRGNVGLNCSSLEAIHGPDVGKYPNGWSGAEFGVMPAVERPGWRRR